MAEKKFYIATFGCQMNDRDSEIMHQLLNESDYAATADMENADLVVVNTCSVREKAEQKAYSLLGSLKKLKRRNPDLIVAVTGCVAQQDGENLLKRIPHADLILGPQKIYDLPQLVKTVEKQHAPQTATELNSAFVIPPFLPDVESGSQFKRFVTIMQGCNNFCTYCVVPFTRGREISRAFDDIIGEVSHLASRGIKEVTLLGQNVNSYGLDSKDKCAACASGEKTCRSTTNADFPALLKAVAQIPGIERLRFTSSHPKDLSVRLMKCFAEIDNLCPHFHLPFQSGSDRILKLMNRRYTAADYLEKVRQLREIRPDIVLTTDIIVGFPGETDEDFEATMYLLEEVRYHSAFSFQYSDRPYAKSADFPDKVAPEVKSARLARLQKRQSEITLARNLEYIGQTMPVMVEGQGKADNQWSGRTVTNHIVNFTGGSALQPGQTVEVEIEEGLLHSLRGRLVG